MKLFKSVLSCLAFFLLGAVVAILLGVTAISYLSVDLLVKASSASTDSDLTNQKVLSLETNSNKDERKDNPLEKNPNIRELIKIGKQYADELTLFDNLVLQINLKQGPDICETLCNPVYLDKERLSEERSSYLANYHKQQGIRTLSDPLFRLRLKEIGFISSLYPPAFRSLLNEVLERNQNNGFSGTDKLRITFKLQSAMAKELTKFYFQRHELIHRAEELKDLRDLHQSCKKGLPRGQIISECKKGA